MAVTSAAVAIAVLSVLIPQDLRAAGQPVALEGAGPNQAIPRVFSARLEGNRLVVEGEGFEDRALILVDGQRLKTRNDPDSPGTRLVANNLGSQIARGKIVRVQVENSTAALSQPLNLFTGRTITLDDNSATIRLNRSQQFLLLLKRAGDPWEWTLTILIHGFSS